MNVLRFLALLTLLLLLACTRNNGPAVEVWDGGAFRPLAHQAYSVTGKRDGSVTRAVATFTLENNTRLEIELVVTYNPTPALGEGRWRIDGARPASGTVEAEAVKFLGGQGEGASVGGRFRLVDDGAPRFRVVLPARPLESEPWSGQ